MSAERSLRFKIRRGDFEVELEGDYDYVKMKFEDLLKEMRPPPAAEARMTPSPTVELTRPPTLRGIIEITPEGKPHLTVPVDALTAKEALALMLYAVHPQKMSNEELSSLLSSSWKAMKPEAVRARASELRRDGKIMSEKGRYVLSGAGVQWVQAEVIPKIRQFQI
jgi:hypothetical protein